MCLCESFPQNNFHFYKTLFFFSDVPPDMPPGNANSIVLDSQGLCAVIFQILIYKIWSLFVISIFELYVT